MQNECEQVEFVASRWAVKEALAKAIGRKELTFNQINIIKDSHGKPSNTQAGHSSPSKATTTNASSSSCRSDSATSPSPTKRSTLLAVRSWRSAEAAQNDSVRQMRIDAWCIIIK